MKKTLRLALLSLALCAIASAVVMANRPNVLTANVPDSDENAQVEFITNFYKGYLSRPDARMHFHVPPGSFYSREAEALIAANSDMCDTLSRGDNMCGYGIGADFFLNAQEIWPDLTFENSHFKATWSGKNTVDVSFSIWPEYGEESYRTLRYVLVKDKAGWRVDDVFFKLDDAFPIRESMRQMISEEEARLLADARNFSDALGWIFIYLREPDMADRIERFVAFPVEICERSGTCNSVRKGDMKFEQAIADLRALYYKDGSETTALGKQFPKRDTVRVAEGSTVEMDGLEMTFQGKAWWLTKIDLARLPQTASAGR